MGGLKDIERAFIQTGRREYKISISDEFMLQIKKIQLLLFNLFGLVCPVRLERIIKGENTYYLNPTNKQIYSFIVCNFDFPKGPKGPDLRIPGLILNSPKPIRKWFLRGVFDADGDTRAVEAGYKSQSRVKLRMAAPHFICQVKKLLEGDFNVSVNGPYFDKGGRSSYIQVEQVSAIKALAKQKIFIHPIKRWRLENASKNPISSHKAQYLKQFSNVN